MHCDFNSVCERQLSQGILVLNLHLIEEIFNLNVFLTYIFDLLLAIYLNDLSGLDEYLDPQNVTTRVLIIIVNFFVHNV